MTILYSYHVVTGDPAALPVLSGTATSAAQAMRLAEAVLISRADAFTATVTTVAVVHRPHRPDTVAAHDRPWIGRAIQGQVFWTRPRASGPPAGIW